MSFSESDHFVYHVTTDENAEKCVVEGIIPGKNSKCSPDSVEMDVRYDAVRPPFVVDAGVARVNCVYAHPELHNAMERKNGGWLNRSQQKLAVLAIYIPNLEEVFVCDGLLNVPPHTPDEYWASFMSLSEYRGEEKPTFRGPNFYSNSTSTYVYMWPEVLIPRGAARDTITRV